MNNFFRVLKLSLRYRWTVVATIVSSLAIALLWGGNIGAIYPFVEIVGKGQSLGQWVDQEVERARSSSETLTAEIKQLTARRDESPTPPTDSERRALDKKIQSLTTRRDAELSLLAARRRIQPTIHRYLPAKPYPTLVVVVIAVLLGTLLKGLFIVSSVVLTERLSHLGTLALRKDFYRRTIRMDLASFGDSGDLMSRFTYDMDQVTQGLRTVFGKAIREPLKMVACFAGAAFICWRLLIVSLIIAPLAGFLIGRLGKSIKRANRRAMEEMSTIYNTLNETFRGIKVVKAFTMERAERWRFHQACKQYFKKAMKIALYNSLIRPTTELMGISTICLALLAGAYLVMNQSTHLLGIRISDIPLTLPQLLLFYGMLVGVSDPARKLSDVFSRIQNSAAAADRIYEMLDRQPNIEESKSPVALPLHERELVLEDVRFAYADGGDVLNDINLTIPFGTTLAIVGPNGCGKSTLANLIPRFFDPTGGTIRLDGVDLRDARLRALRSQIGVVTQETLLFNDTIENNIRYGRPDATHEQIVAAAKQAHVHRIIEDNLEQGYATVVGEGGSRLSGGQRQRIALARAILRDPQILILDEATSQVDIESEQVIHRVLADFLGGRTAIIITHRIAILDLADQILVMDEGRILDQGTHAELIAGCPLYQRLYKSDLRASA